MKSNLIYLLLIFLCVQPYAFSEEYDKESSKILKRLVRDGVEDLKKAESLLKLKADPTGGSIDIYGHKNDSNLHWCIVYNLLDMTTLLIKYGADVNWESYWNSVPIFTATVYKNIEIIRILLKNEAIPDYDIFPGRLHPLSRALFDKSIEIAALLMGYYSRRNLFDTRVWFIQHYKNGPEYSEDEYNDVILMFKKYGLD